MVTPQTESPEIARELGVGALYLKREDLHPLGSHKGRSIPVMIDLKVAKGATDFAISSSGNAALAAARHIKARNAAGSKLSLLILVGRNIEAGKLKRLQEEAVGEPRIRIEAEARPLQALFNLIKNDGKTSLRQSNDPDALVGYRTLAAEIAATPNLEAVFIGTSSGTTAEALADYFVEHAGRTGEPFPQVHVVQTAGVSPIAKAFAQEESEPEASLADAIVDKVAHRALSVENAVRKTAGHGWIASNADIRRAIELLRDKAGIEATPNGALSLAGLIKARASGRRFAGSVVCVVTGK
ncbi:MAG TPA: PLP-dependent lyase/thiolase [Candidatus Paceibacterota bacterium]|nr:PLP-dependent lyase/thiolase [Candidatus Paceibacterota bacterium]